MEKEAKQKAKPGALLAPAKLLERARRDAIHYTYRFHAELTVDLEFDDFDPVCNNEIIFLVWIEIEILFHQLMAALPVMTHARVTS